MPVDSQPGAWIDVSERRGTLLAALACGAIGVAFLIGAFRYDFGSFSVPGPAVFPVLAACGLVVMSAALALRALRMPAQAGGTRIELGHRNSMAAILALCFVALAFEKVGYGIASFVMLITLSQVFSQAGWIRSALFAVLVTGSSYVIFTRGLGVVLPSGLLGLR